MRLGLIGAGRWGKRYISTICAMSDVELAYLASSNPASKGLVADSCHVTADWRDLISARDLDGIIIATPPHTHMVIALAAIEAGLPVLIEKPLTLAIAEAKQIANAAVRCGVLVVVDHTHLYSPAYRELKQRGKQLGALMGLQSCGSNWGPFRTDTPMLWDYAPHDVAMCIDLAGKTPAGWDAVVEKCMTTTEGSGAAIQLQLHFVGTVAQIRVSNVDQDKNRWLEATYVGGKLRYDDLREPKLTFIPANSSLPQEVSTAATLPLTVVVQEFCEKIAAGMHSDPSLELGIRIVAILAAFDEKLNVSTLSARN